MNPAINNGRIAVDLYFWVDLFPMQYLGPGSESNPTGNTGLPAFQPVTIGWSDGNHVFMEEIDEVFPVSLGPTVIQFAKGLPNFTFIHILEYVAHFALSNDLTG